MRDRVKRWLSRPGLPWLAVLAAVLLSLTALGNGFIADDYFLRATSLGLNPPAMSVGSKWDLFRLFPPDPHLVEARRELGLAPWWMPTNFAVAFFRPLTSALHQVDFALWPNSAFWMHAHSLAWLAATVFVAAHLYRRFESRAWVAGVAALVFATDHVHSIPVGWISNRGALVAAFFVALGLLAHDRWRRGGSRTAGVLAPLALAAGLAAGEIALAALGYLIAHALVFEESWRDRLRALGPGALVIVLWRAVYVVLGYRTQLSGLYVDPLRSPWQFAGASVVRFPTLFFAQLAGLPSDVVPALSPSARGVLVTVGIAGSLLILVGLRRLLRVDPVSRFWALGLALAIVPGCATFPNDRLLFIASIGAAPLVARALASWGADVSRGFCSFLVVIHLVLSPLAMPWRVRSIKPIGDVGVRMVRALPRDLAGRALVVVNAPDGLLCLHLITDAAPLGVDRPDVLRCLGVTTGALEVHRESDRTLLLRPERSYFSAPLDGLMRAPELPWRVGDGAATSIVSVNVARLDGDGRPSELRALFQVPMDSDAIRLITWDGHGLVPFVPPPVGGTARFPATSLLGLLSGE